MKKREREKDDFEVVSNFLGVLQKIFKFLPLIAIDPMGPCHDASLRSLLSLRGAGADAQIAAAELVGLRPGPTARYA